MSGLAVVRRGVPVEVMSCALSDVGDNMHGEVYMATGYLIGQATIPFDFVVRDAIKEELD